MDIYIKSLITNIFKCPWKIPIDINLYTYGHLKIPMDIYKYPWILIYIYPWTFINTHGHIYMSHFYTVLRQTAPHIVLRQMAPYIYVCLHYTLVRQ